MNNRLALPDNLAILFGESSMEARMDIAGAIGAVTTSIALVREIKEIDAAFDKAELKLKIAELTSSLADAKLGLIEVDELLRAKDKEIEHLKKEARFRKEELFDDGVYRYRIKNGQPNGYPICPVCEGKGSFINIVQQRGNGISYVCPACRSNYGAHVPHKKEGPSG